MHIKRIKHILAFVALLVMGLLITGCGSEINLGASMSGISEIEENTAVNDEFDEPDESDEYDYDDTKQDEEDEEIEQVGEEQETDDNTITVVLNTNKERKRIHIPGTSCANQIHEENYLEWTGTEAELINYAKDNGYVACGRCHPDTKLGIDLPKN